MRFFGAVIATGLLLVFGSSTLCAFPLTLVERERLKRFIPRSFPKLEARDPVHVVALGDSVTGGHTPLPTAWENNNPLFSYTGVFLGQIAKEFFYPGGVKLLNPPENGSARSSDYLGDEITFENLTEFDGTSLTGLRRASTDAFLHDPDILLVQFGIYDSFGRISIDTYRRALQDIVKIAKDRSVDVILLGPGLVNFGGGEIEWGVTRPYSMAAREVAAANDVLFLDTGRYLSKFGAGVDPKTEPEAAMEIVGDRLARIFYFGPELKTRERIHTSFETNDYLGEAMFDDLKEGPIPSSFSLAGVANFQENGLVNVTIAIRNQTDESQQGTIGALAVGDGLIPVADSQRFSVPARATTQLSFDYRRPIIGEARDGSDILFPLQPTDEFCRFSFLIEDTVHSEIVDLPLRIGPITAVWKSRQFLNVTDRVRIEWDLVNGSDKAISGTFQVGMGDKVGQPTDFSVSPLGTKSVFSLFEFAGTEDPVRFQRDVWIQTEVNGVVTRFYREMEACRDLVLGEEIRLRSWNEYANAAPAGEARARQRQRGAVTARFDADEDALYLVARLEGIQIPDLGDRAALRARIYLDGRSAEEVLTFGAVHPVDVYTKGSDGPGYTPEIALGAFGRGYNMILSGKGITSVLKTGEGGERVVEVRIPKSYLFLHEWTLDSVESVLGFRLEITIADSVADAAIPFPPGNSFVTSSPTLAFENRVIHGFFPNDARSLSALRFSRQPVGSWSVRIY